MKNKLLIIGASGHGKVVADVANKMNKWKTIAFLDDNLELKTSLGYEVLGSTDKVSDFIDQYQIFVAIGNNQVRELVYKQIKKLGACIATIIHPSAIVSDYVEIGTGTVVMAGTVINCCTKIGEGCIINTGSTIDHDNNIGDFVHISPGVHLAGTVTVGNGSWLGIGCIVSNNIKIINKCTVGAGSIVVKDITESGTYVGIPSKRIR